MRYCELKRKEVINIVDGKSLGFISDLEIDEKTGCIRELIIPVPGKWCGLFCRDSCYCVDYCDIIKIGPDIILVKVCELQKSKK